MNYRILFNGSFYKIQHKSWFGSWKDVTYPDTDFPSLNETCTFDDEYQARAYIKAVLAPEPQWQTVSLLDKYGDKL